MPNSNFTILSTQPWSYLDPTGRVVTGYRVFYHLPEFDETHSLEVPSLDPALVKREIEKLYKQRKDLSTL